MKRLLWVTAGLFVGMAAYLYLTPCRIDALAYFPPTSPQLVGPLAPNQTLQKADLLGKGQLQGPEDTAMAADGALYCGCADGWIKRITTDGKVEDFVNTGGRPLGMEFDARGNLIVCDAPMGLLSISPKGEITVLATQANDRPFRFTDDLDIASDGKIYFSDASNKYGTEDYLYDLLEHRPNGRLLVYDPATGQVRVLLRDLYFANGVALSADESFVLVNETYTYRVRRLWLKGPKAGETDILISNLPGFPDNISRAPDGSFWLALFTVRNPIMDMAHPHPVVKRTLAKLPKAFWPSPSSYGLVLRISPDGTILQSLHDPDGEHLPLITSAKQAGDYLYLGSLNGDRVGRLRLSDAAPPGLP